MSMFEDALAAAALYAGLSLVWLLILSVMVTRARLAHKVTLGDGGNEAVRQAVRAHGNAAEYLPLGVAGLVLLAFLEAPWAVHAAGAPLILGRVLHGIGLLGNPGRSFGRAAGTLLTWGAFLVLAGLLFRAAAG